MKTYHIILIVLLAWTTNLFSQEKIYIVQKIDKDGEATIFTWQRIEEEIITIPGINVPYDTAEKSNPLSLLWFSFPSKENIKKELLTKGLVSLNNYTEESSSYQSDQNEAKANRLGMWSTLPKPSPLANVPQQFNQSKSDPSFHIEWLKLGVAFLGFGGIMQIIGFVIVIIKNKHVDVILIGRPSTGKSWVWGRVSNPQIRLSELLEKYNTKSDIVKEERFPPITYGRFMINPTYTDIPGEESEEVAHKVKTPRGVLRILTYLPRKIFKKRQIWIVCFSTSQQEGVNINSDPSEKMDLKFINEQMIGLNALRPILLDKDDDYYTPLTIIACITKCDLFLSDAPHAKPLIKEHVNEVEKIKQKFDEHINYLTELASSSGKKINVQTILFSASEGWGLASLENAIKLNAL